MKKYKELKNVAGVHTGNFNKGITLVALVVTIIILLILAGITISQLTGSGLFKNAKLAEEQSKEAQKKEERTLENYENQISDIVGSRDSVSLTTEEYKSGCILGILCFTNFNRWKDFNFR